ncbi:MAG: apolipoprotein N-acyltransferase [Acidobacteriota bacterium]
MKFPRVAAVLPDIKSVGLALLSAILLILAFPDFEYWFLAWVGLVPLLLAVEREKKSFAKAFGTGWIFGIVFFFGTCWWLTFAPITYAGFPALLAYCLLFCVTAVAGLFPGLFAGALSFLVRRLGARAFFAAPVLWASTEFLRYWLTGNNWNAIGYSQALGGSGVQLASVGGIYMVGFLIVGLQSSLLFAFYHRKKYGPRQAGPVSRRAALAYVLVFFCVNLLPGIVALTLENYNPSNPYSAGQSAGFVVAVQPNVPMAGLTQESWTKLRTRHVELTASAFATAKDKYVEYLIGSPESIDDREIVNDIVEKRFRTRRTTVIFPESPMNFMFDEDPEFQDFVGRFAAKNNVNVLFNSAEPDAANKKYFNSAVLVDTEGREIAQYDKIYLLPFGESVPWPLQSIMPAFVGSFSYGKEYDLIPLGDAKAGVMICFESHFGELSRRYVRDGADVLIEMTNDGYLGPTPVLRQHLANAVFRAVETNRPVLRVTNVGVTAYINERGEVIDPAESYTEATRVWSVSKSDGSQTFYVKYGDWFAWLCAVVTIALIGFAMRQNRSVPPA